MPEGPEVMALLTSVRAKRAFNPGRTGTSVAGSSPRHLFLKEAQQPHPLPSPQGLTNGCGKTRKQKTVLGQTVRGSFIGLPDDPRKSQRQEPHPAQCLHTGSPPSPAQDHQGLPSLPLEDRPASPGQRCSTSGVQASRKRMSFSF